MKKILCLMIAVIFLFVPMLQSCEEKGENADMKVTNTVQIEMEDGGIIKIAIYGEAAPKTAENFVKLASEGFYDGLIFHRVIENFMIQGGDPEGTGFGGSGTNIYGEFALNGFNNPVVHERGVISMGRTAYDYNSASSQFFICHIDSPHLDGGYAAFGQVIEGMDVVDKIASVDTDFSDKPINAQVMKKVTVLE